MPRKCFFSFHYRPDCWRAAQVRNMGMVDGNTPVSDNDWESVVRGGDERIRRWIDRQLAGRSCTVVLVGARTAGRKWITHEIIESWNRGMGVLGVRIHGLLNSNGDEAEPGDNPFKHVYMGSRPLSSAVKLYDPQGADSKDCYDIIYRNLDDIVDEAIGLRGRY